MLSTHARTVVLARWTKRRLLVHAPRPLRNWLLSRSSPEVILIELTNDCNQSCPFCSRESMTRSVGYMPFEVFTSLVDQAARLPYVMLRVVGLGEAAMHPRFRDCIRYASERQIPMEITSNGHILEVLSVDEIANSSLVMLSISIDGFGDGTYEKLRPGGDYGKLRRNIEHFYRTISKRRKRPYFTLRNVLLGKTVEHRSEQSARFVKEWSGLCDRISFNEYLSSNLSKRNEGRLRVCDDILYNLHVEWDGSTPLCTYQHLITQQERTGNAAEVPIHQIWDEPRRTEVRRAHITGNLQTAPFCAKCPKTRRGAVYNNVRDYGRNRSPVRHYVERLLWRMIA